jgi:hypothetical protein
VHFEDEVVVAASREQVWAFLQDPHALGRCMPGLETVEVIEPGRAFGGQARIAFGTLEVEFPAQVEWLEREEMSKGRLRALADVAGHQFEGQGTLELVDAAEAPGTRVTWSASVTMPDALAENPLAAQMGKAVALRFIKGFFECIESRLKTV